jgi:hypothetical protein
MNGTGEHYLKWLWAGSKGQKTHVLSHMWIIDLIETNTAIL